jgi:hypothetical protein
MIPARTDVVLSEQEIAEAARRAPRVALGAACHLLPQVLLIELAELEPEQALYFASDLLPVAVVDRLRKVVSTRG